MKQFFKFFFASCLGTAGALIIIGLIGLGFVGKAIKSANKKDTVKANSVLTINLDTPVPEHTNNAPFSPADFKNDEVTGLIDMVAAIERAKDDDDIKGILIESSMPALNFAGMAMVRRAIEDFKTSGKFVVSYADYYTEGAYYLASSADEIYLNPIGGMEFNGFAAQIPFFKEMLDKLGVQFEIFYAGDFKSATEPYRLTQMSDNNRLQVREYLNDIYGNFLADIAQSRDMEVSTLRRYADELLISEAEDALKYELVDSLAYRDELLGHLRTKLGLSENKDIPAISLSKYASLTQPKTNLRASEKIAVVFAEGSITDGAEAPGVITGDAYAKIIRKIRTNDNYKAIVLRVNSPGGSALASEKIWRELTLAREQGIPVVVSMGDYAASGGYYIACMADTIFAEANTITGSIGVFSMFPNAQKLMNEKLGVTIDTVKTNPYAVGINPAIELSQKEKDQLTVSTQAFYETFLKRVADGRGMTRDEAHAVAQGRVWTGSKAIELGLVDALGDLDDAIETAARMAGISDFRKVAFPEAKSPIEQIVEELMGGSESVKKAMIKDELGDMYTVYQRAKMLQEMEGIQARFPYELTID